MHPDNDTVLKLLCIQTENPVEIHATPMLQAKRITVQYHSIILDDEECPDPAFKLSNIPVTLQGYCPIQDTIDGF
jgi:hypothetical protein